MELSSPREGDTAFGGGIGYTHFFNRNIGIDVNYGLYSTDKEHHQFDGNLVLRAPIDSLCIAPYALVGGGYRNQQRQLRQLSSGWRS